MLFRTRYATKVRVKSNSLAKDHIEPYVPSAINANCVVLEDSELAAAQELQIECIPEVLLNEREVENIIDNPSELIQDDGLGIYVLMNQNKKFLTLRRR